jgi:hypothetical protein
MLRQKLEHTLACQIALARNARRENGTTGTFQREQIGRASEYLAANDGTKFGANEIFGRGTHDPDTFRPE